MRSIVLPVVLSILAFPALAQTPSRPAAPPVPPAEAYQWIHLNGTVQNAFNRGITANLWEATANEGESADEFVARIGRSALLVLEASQATICGQLVDSAGKQTIQMRTTNKAADCIAPGSKLPFVLVKSSEPGAEMVGPFPNELPGPVYAVKRTGVEFKDGKSSRPVTSYGKNLMDPASR